MLYSTADVDAILLSRLLRTGDAGGARATLPQSNKVVSVCSCDVQEDKTAHDGGKAVTMASKRHAYLIHKHPGLSILKRRQHIPAARRHYKPESSSNESSKQYQFSQNLMPMKRGTDDRAASLARNVARSMGSISSCALKPGQVQRLSD